MDSFHVRVDKVEHFKSSEILFRVCDQEQVSGADQLQHISAC